MIAYSVDLRILEILKNVNLKIQLFQKTKLKSLSNNKRYKNCTNSRKINQKSI